MKCSFLLLTKSDKRGSKTLSHEQDEKLLKSLLKVHFTIFFSLRVEETKLWKRSRWSWYFILFLFRKEKFLQPFANARLAKNSPVTSHFLRSFNFAYLLHFFESHHFLKVHFFEQLCHAFFLCKEKSLLMSRLMRTIKFFFSYCVWCEMI